MTRFRSRLLLSLAPADDYPPEAYFEADGRTLLSLTRGGAPPPLRERLLKLYDRYGGPPTFCALHVWHYGMYQSGAGRDGGTEERRAATIPVAEWRDGKLVPAEIPNFGGPGTEELRRAVIDGLLGLMRELDWPEDRLILGAAGDAFPSRIAIDFFKRLAPAAQWRAATHGRGMSHWGVTPEQRTHAANGMVVRYGNLVRRNIWTLEKPAACCVAVIARDVIGCSPLDHDGCAPLAAVAAKYDGYTWRALDYWHGVLSRCAPFGNITPHGPRACVYPDTDGAAATVPFGDAQAGPAGVTRSAAPRRAGRCGRDGCRASAPTTMSRRAGPARTPSGATSS